MEGSSWREFSVSFWLLLLTSSRSWLRRRRVGPRRESCCCYCWLCLGELRVDGRATPEKVPHGPGRSNERSLLTIAPHRRASIPRRLGDLPGAVLAERVGSAWELPSGRVRLASHPMLAVWQ